MTAQEDMPGTVGPYRVVRRLRGDGTWATYLGETDVGRRVEVHVLAPALSGDDAVRERLAAEVAAARLVIAPDVAGVVDADTGAGRPWVATQYVPGLPLSAAVFMTGALPAASVLVLADTLARSLAMLHAGGRVHRRVVPSNIQLTRYGASLLGLGIGIADGGWAAAGYAPPETITGGVAGAPGDVFGLGAVLAYAAAGRHPFGDGLTRDTERRVLAGDLRVELPAEVAEIIRPCLDADPGSRPSARRLLHEIIPHYWTGYSPDWLPPRLVRYVEAAEAGGGTPTDGLRGADLDTPTWGDVPAEPEPAMMAPPASVPAPAPETAEPETVAPEMMPEQTGFAEPAEAYQGWGAPSWCPSAPYQPPPQPTPPYQAGAPAGSPPPPPGSPPPAGAGQAGGAPYEAPAPPPGYGPQTPRYLKGQCPQSVRAGEPFSVLASVVVSAREGVAPMKSFDVGPRGRDVLLVLHAPGLRVLGPQRQRVRVPSAGDSEPVMFELQADAPGPQQASITAWADGTYLGQLDVETTATRWPLPHRGYRDVTAEIGTEPVSGAVSLVVRHDPRQNSYRFEFRDEDNPEEVASNLAYEPGPRVERLVAGLDRLAQGRSGYSAAETRDYLVNAGAALWTELLPAQLREQFWARQHRISQLTILSDSDVVPWELLYPLDPGHDQGFLVEQFPVTRVLFGRRPARTLRLNPAWFVLPDGSPSRARDEVTALLDLFYPTPSAQPPVVEGLTPLLDLIGTGDFGLLHFACHNAFDPADGSSIMLDRRQFTPTQLTTAAIGQVLAAAGPTVFINACRSAGASPSYHRLDGWARKFLDAGAAAFVGSLWAVRDSTARDFAGELYRLLRGGASLGDAAMAARRAAAAEPGDPTWLAYAVYGDPRATLRY